MQQGLRVLGSRVYSLDPPPGLENFGWVFGPGRFKLGFKGLGFWIGFGL